MLFEGFELYGETLRIFLMQRGSIVGCRGNPCLLTHPLFERKEIKAIHLDKIQTLCFIRDHHDL